MKKLNKVLQNAGLPLLVAVTVILLIAACGSSGDSSGTAASPEEAIQVEAVALNQLKITWPEPADAEEAAAVDYYKVELLMADSAVIVKRVEKGATETVMSVSSGAYTARVTVIKTVGEAAEPWSSTRAVSIDTKATAPGAATVEATASPVSSGDEEAKISLILTAPTETGTNAGKGNAATMDAYIVYWQAGAAVSELDYMGKEELEGDASSYTIEGLEQGRDYSIIVVARNSAGLESASTAQTVSSALSPNPAAVAEFSATTAEDAISITLRWQQATDFGRTTGGAVAGFSSYKIYWAEGSTVDTTGTEISITEETTTAKTLTAADGLQPETQYSFMIVVENDASASSAVRRVTATTPDLSVVPAVVTGFSATAATDAIRIDLAWNEATNFGKTAAGEDAGFGSYKIYWAEGSTVDSTGTAVSIATATDTTRTLRGLLPETQYSFMIVVENAEGERSAEARAEASTPNLSEPPAAPQIDTESITSSSTDQDATISLSWTVNANGKQKNGAAATIAAYLIYWKEGATVSESDAAAGAPVKITDATVLSVVLGELKPGTEYSLMVVAVNNGERRSSSSVAQKTTEAASPTVIAPQAVTGVGASKDATSLDIALNWTEATTFGSVNGSDATFKEYRIYWKKGSEVAVSGPPQAQVTPAATTSYTITGLEAATEYSIAVVMVNSNDHVGPVEAESKTTIITNDLSTKPGAASNIRKDSSHKVITELKVLWDAPTTKARNRAGSEVETAYELYYASSAQYADAAALIAGETAVGRIEAGGTLELILKDLEAATAYDVVVVAVNSAVEEKQEPSAIAALTSNGVRSVNIRDGDATVSGTTVTKLITGGSFTLSAEVEGENVEGLVSWESSNENVVKVTETENAVSMTAEGIGTASITATSVEDSTKTATVSIEVEKEDIGLGNYHFEYGEVSTVYGAEETFTITRNTIPATELIYSITQNPEVGKITVQNAETGSIYVSGDLEKGSYTIEVSAEASGEDPNYKGTVKTTVSIVVEEEKLVYKAEMSSAAQGVFAIGDTENSYLFQVRGLADTAGVVATIEMKDAGGRVLAQTPERPVVYEEATGTSIVGAGFSEGDVDFNTLSGQLSIKVMVKVDGELYAEKIVEVATAGVGALYSWRDLQAMENDLAGTYTLQSDIAFPAPGTYGFPASGFVPIGDSSTVFSGTLNGNGKTISDLYINAPSLSYVGLFGYIADVIKGTEVVKDLTLQDPNITGASYVGALAGRIDRGTVKSGGVSSKETANGMVVTGSSNNIGGLVGINYDTVTGYVTGVVSGNTNIGGLVGQNHGTVTGYVTGAVSGSSGNTGALVGTNNGGTITGYARGTVERSEGTHTSYGLLVGTGLGKGYYSLAESSFVGISKDEATGFSGNPLPMRAETTKEAFVKFDFEDGPWRWVADGQWPAIDIGNIKPINEQPTERSDSALPEDACVTAVDNRPEFSAGFYQIDSWQELQWMENCLYENYKLTANIAIPNPGQSGVPQEGFRPVGTNVNPFIGNFYGGGYSITGFSIARPESNYVGLFGYVYGGRIENLHIEHSGIEGLDFVGAVVGYAEHAEIKGISMASEGNEEVSGRISVGGLVGVNYGTVAGYTTGEVSGSNIASGGLVGANYGTVIGYATGSLSGAGTDVGGLVGQNYDTVIGYATGTVSGNARIGGLVGHNSGGTIIGYATGMVAEVWYAHALVGQNYNDGTVTGYWNRGIASDEGEGRGISSTANIYYYTAATEPSGREQYMYYDLGTGTDPSNEDSGDEQIFNDGDFASIFELPKADGVWPKLEKSFTVGDKTITLPKAMYDAQESIVNWPTATE